MNVPCALIEDLLPLYYDEVCSQDSRALVEEHLQECAACRRKLADLREEMEHPKEDQTELLFLHAAQKVLIQRKRKTFLKGAFLTVLIVLIAVSPLWLTLTKNQAVSTENIEVGQRCQLTNGSLLFHLYVDDGKDLRRLKYDLMVDSEGKYSAYITPYHSILEAKRDSDVGLFNCYIAVYIMKDDMDVPNQAGAILDPSIERVYVGTPEDRILVWERGQVLPKASAKMERMMDIYESPFTEEDNRDWEQYSAELERILGDEMFRKEDAS